MSKKKNAPEKNEDFLAKEAKEEAAQAPAYTQDIPEDEIWTYRIEGLQEPRIGRPVKNVRQKKVAVVIILLIAIGLAIYLSMRAVHTDTFQYALLEDGTVELVKFSNPGSVTTLTIDTTDDDAHQPITALHEFAFNCDEKITEITIGKTVTAIEATSFYSCWALQKIKDFSDEKDLHITKAATSGYSSGAHISMLYSYARTDTFPLELPFTMNMVGPSDLSYSVWGDTGYRLASMLSGTQITEAMIADGSAQAVVDSVSPVKYVNANTMPSLFAYGGQDNTVPAGNAQAVKDAFDAAGAPYDFILFPHADHIIFLRDPHKTVELLNALLDYCKTYFGY